MDPNYNTFDTSKPSITERQRRNRKLILITAVIASAIAVVGWFLNNVLSQKTVTLKPSSGMTITFGEPSHGEEGAGIAVELGKASGEAKELRVKPGFYAAIFTGEGIKQTRQLIEVEADTTVASPTPTYTDAKLLELLSEQKTAIHNTLANNDKTKAYLPKNELLYQDGTWYAAKLVPADTVNQDTLVVILHKSDNAWRIVAGPEISLFIGNHPSVPEDIIRDVNNRPLE